MPDGWDVNTTAANPTSRGEVQAIVKSGSEHQHIEFAERSVLGLNGFPVDGHDFVGMQRNIVTLERGIICVRQQNSSRRELVLRCQLATEGGVAGQLDESVEPCHKVRHSSMKNRVPGQLVVEEEVCIKQEIEQACIKEVEEGDVATEESPGATVPSIEHWCDVSWGSTVDIQSLDFVCDHWDDLQTAIIEKKW